MPLDFCEFNLRYGEVVSSLSELLDMKFIGDPDTEIEKYLDKSLRRVLELNNEGQLVRRDYQLMRLMMFAKHLNEVKNYDKELFKDFKTDFDKITYNEYFGTRFEIATASSFIRNNVDFTNRESPDFEINAENKVYVECTSSHLSKSKDRDLKYKIYDRIKKKSKKEYESPDTALFIDITNIFYHSSINNNDLDKEGIKEYIGQRMDNSRFGSFLIWSFIGDVDSGRFEFNYIRKDNRNIDAELENFLDQNYPLEDHHIDSSYLPSEG